MKITAVVVTYNRKQLLQECIKSLLSQTYPLDSIIIIDNHSDAETKDMVDEVFHDSLDKIDYYYLNKNYGGSGGFYYGIKKACLKHEADWIWAMDDDTIPLSDALEKLVNALTITGTDISFLASKVNGINSEPMNVPSISSRAFTNGSPFWYQYLEDGLVEIDVATLVSLLFNAKAVKKCGLPYKNFFIWGDDAEYTKRLTTHFGPAYFCGKSKAIHKRANPEIGLNMFREENVNRINNYKYMVRNTLIYTKTYFKKSLWKKKLGFQSLIFKSLFVGKHRWTCFKTLTKGFWGYMFGTYNRKAYKKRFENLNDIDDME